MKFNRLNRYSKILALIILIALLVIGFYLGMIYQKTVSDDSYKVLVDNDKLTVLTKYEDGLLKYLGTVRVSDPCHYYLEDGAKLLKSPSEKVRINVRVKKIGTDQICTAVLSEEEFSGYTQVSKDTPISINLNEEIAE